ncbi:orc1/cdc6 family replication initiation protein [Haloprofundus salilacus]|uniref:Cdc6/Cdc18 family protein n=1 Tax=Haloprofundus salilacus TaxID=2876190 RepID=UPI00295F5510|nr:orc1/cdc6 family replication initiation protein [Haloprofundus salilacus]
MNVITDARALRPEYLPQELYHREGQITQLSSVLRPITHGDVGEDAFIFGPSGVGKTTTAKFVLRQLEREALGIRWGYVNCMSDSSKSAVLHALARHAGRAADLRIEGTPASMFIDRLRELDGQFVAVLDEVDVLEDLTTLLALNDLPNVTMILITVYEDDLFADLDSRVESRLRGAGKVRLEKYSHDEMVDILRGRISAGLGPNTVSDEAVDYIADTATGDARFGIALLRRSARWAIEMQRSQITTDVVDEIRDDARDELHMRHVDALSTHQRMLYEIIKDAGELGAGELRERYEERSGSNAKTPRMQRKYLNGLARYKLIRSKGSGRWTQYEVQRH